MQCGSQTLPAVACSTTCSPAFPFSKCAKALKMPLIQTCWNKHLSKKCKFTTQNPGRFISNEQQKLRSTTEHHSTLSLPLSLHTSAGAYHSLESVPGSCHTVPHRDPSGASSHSQLLDSSPDRWRTPPYCGITEAGGESQQLTGLVMQGPTCDTHHLVSACSHTAPTLGHLGRLFPEMMTDSGCPSARPLHSQPLSEAA